MYKKERSVEGTNTQMAIDLLCCHLGITEEEAEKADWNQHRKRHRQKSQKHSKH